MRARDPSGTNQKKGRDIFFAFYVLFFNVRSGGLNIIQWSSIYALASCGSSEYASVKVLDPMHCRIDKLVLAGAIETFQCSATSWVKRVARSQKRQRAREINH